jgi:hypothetical protein
MAVSVLPLLPNKQRLAGLQRARPDRRPPSAYREAGNRTITGRPTASRGQTMKITIDTECTPEEARRFLGLPDLSPVHDAYVAKLQRLIEDGVQSGDIESMLRSWGPMGDAGMAMWRQMFDKMTDPASR